MHSEDKLSEKISESNNEEINNILILSIEDLNDWIEPLKGHPNTVTPNLNRLAKISANFQNAFAPVPACSPSRSATLFSRDPITTGIFTNHEKWYDFHGNDSSDSIFGELNKAGFKCYGAGKVFHGGYPEKDFEEYCIIPKKENLKYPNLSDTCKNSPGNQFDFGIIDSNNKTDDDYAVEFILRKINEGSQKNVWACGIFRPHLPFLAKKEFFDSIDENVSMPLGMLSKVKDFDPFDKNENKNIAKIAGNAFSKKFRGDGINLNKFNEYKGFIRSYLACINYVDYLVGKILDRLEECKQIEKTLIVLWSDHGWQLGEKLNFRKFTLWDRSVRVPLMISGPSIPVGDINTPISNIDIAPTILDLLNVDIPTKFNGKSFKKELKKETKKKSRKFVSSVWTLGKKGEYHKNIKGVSLRTKNFRYILYSTLEEELYKHPRDKYEHINLIHRKKFANKKEVKYLKKISYEKMKKFIKKTYTSLKKNVS